MSLTISWGNFSRGWAQVCSTGPSTQNLGGRSSSNLGQAFPLGNSRGARGPVTPRMCIKSSVTSCPFPCHWSKHGTGPNPKSAGRGYTLGTENSYACRIPSHLPPTPPTEYQLLMMLDWVSRRPNGFHPYSQEAQACRPLPTLGPAQFWKLFESSTQEYVTRVRNMTFCV